MLDTLDRQVLHALQSAPRVPFRRLAEVLGVSEQTVARRYRALLRTGAVRVVGVVDPAAQGLAEWITRIRCRPDRVGPLADALVRREEIAYAHVASGGSEITCIVRAPLGAAPEEGLLGQLPRHASVLDVSIDLLLHIFGGGRPTGWTGYGDLLTPEQLAALVDDDAAEPGPPVAVSPDDAPLLTTLAADGRASLADLASATGWSPGRVARRMAALERAGALDYRVDLLPEALDRPLAATLWLRVAPAHLDRVGTQVAAHDEVAFAAATSGRNNIMATVWCRDPHDLYRYLARSVADTPGIDGYEVSIRARRLKQAVSVVSRGRLVRA
ncbi:Lrp/AsnC family transcriptional regulator [Cellulomonas sp. Marseille-Q8402]